jgi:hypothetical protein
MSVKVRLNKLFGLLLAASLVGFVNIAYSQSQYSDSQYRVYVRGFSNYADAEYYRSHYTAQAYPNTGVTSERTFNQLYWVYIGPLASKQEMHDVTMEIHDPGYRARQIEKNKPVADVPNTSLKRFTHRKYATIQFGFFNTNQSAGAQSIKVNSSTWYQYYPTDQQKINLLVGLGAYLNAFEKESYLVDYGVNAYYFLTNYVNGNIYVNQNSKNYDFRYTYYNIPVYASLKTEFKTRMERLSVVGDFGIGPNFSQTSKITETPIVAGAVPLNPFNGKSQVNFSLMVGAGVKFKDVLKFNAVECGYRFFYLGAGGFDSTNLAVQNNLTTGIDYQNAFLCSVNWG